MSVKQASDNGFIIAGDTSSYGAGGTDLWLIKTDESGIEQWNQTFGASDDDWGGSVFQTSDGGYIVSGDTRSYGPGGFDVWLIKVDEFGIEEWNMTYGRSNSDDTGYCIHQALDGGYIVAVSSTSYITGFTDILLIKTDGNGIEQWRKTFGGTNDDWGYSVDQTTDEGFVLTGYTTSYGAGNLDVWLIKTDANGNCNFEGELTSVNLLTGKNVISIDMFNCTASIPAGNRVIVQFSQDNFSWYDSTGALDGIDILMDGFNSIDLSLLGWSGSDFYYRLNLSSRISDSTVVHNVNISYCGYHSSGEFISQPFDCGGANVEWKTLIWIASEPSGSEIKFQLRSADIQSNLSTANFSGPDGDPSTYYTVSGSDIWVGHNGYRWVQFKTYLIGAGNITPILQEVTIYYNFILESPTNLTLDIWLNNLIINWTPPQDSPSIVDQYHIYRSTTWDDFDFSVPWVNTSMDPDPIDGLIIPLRTTWNDTFAYLDESNNYFYVVRAINNEGWIDTNMNIVGKYVISLEEGWNLISLPLAHKDTNISEVLRSIDGDYNLVQWYDANEGIWCSSTTDLTEINRTMGLWIHMNNSSMLTIIGSVPESTDITLYEGWNLVGYPSLKTRNLNDALSGIEWQAVQCYDASDAVDPWKHNNTMKFEIMNDLKEMQPDCGYWVYVTVNDTWIRT
jgi:predicted secreted protein